MHPWSDMMPPGPDAADLRACREMLASGSKSFFAASLLLPRHVHEPATALYAFCRVADDAVDLETRADTLPRLHERLARAYAGRPLPIAADRAFAAVIAQHSIPRALPEALLDGFAWDREGRRYETLEDLHGYAARVAGTVGAMMTVLMGERDPDVVARACDLGSAMQLSNIARDVGEDARNGRIYLPLAWLREEGVDPDAWLADPVFSPAIGRVVERLLAEADRLYRRAEAGIVRLPRACRPGIGAARFIYAEIGRAVERQGLDSVSRRAVVPLRRKLALLARAYAPLRPAADLLAVPPLGANAYLVQAVAEAPMPRSTRRPTVARKIEWVVDLFARMEARDAALGRAQP